MGNTALLPTPPRSAPAVPTTLMLRLSGRNHLAPRPSDAGLERIARFAQNCLQFADMGEIAHLDFEFDAALANMQVGASPVVINL